MSHTTIPNEAAVKEIQNWLTEHIAKVMKINPSKIDITTDFEQLGLDSITKVQITESLGEWLGYNIDPTLLYDNNSIEAVSLALVSTQQ
jgi:acyl carrier protein